MTIIQYNLQGSQENFELLKKELDTNKDFEGKYNETLSEGIYKHKLGEMAIDTLGEMKERIGSLGIAYKEENKEKLMKIIEKICEDKKLILVERRWNGSQYILIKRN